ncbi:hypothetical protein CK203_085672 [Vitis vinifera]|uniref:Retrovirus-related Pol polyprotein from transposon RE1 n=1 Tax=Vitis vinifera TaxID=29760 RepID=A0A438BLI6_VITVI|nr:hypothetical protein CK203_085672 [Vitis vinifera]
MEEAKTPMSSSIKLDMDEKGKPVNSTMYRGMIGSLLYLTASRPDIMYSAYGIPKGDNFELIGYSDVDFADCKVEWKSTSGTCHFLGHSLVSWHSKKQNSVALSTVEAEYIAAGFQLVRASSLYTARLRVCSAPSPAQGKRPTEPSQPKQMEARQKHFEFEELFGWMGWLPLVTISELIFSTLVRAFYSGVTYGLEGPVLSTMRGVEIKLSPESI